jgi:sterol 3beta-glucosyltransferase
MRITITTGGSRGDVQPYVALRPGLKEASHEVLLAAPATFEGLVREHGLGFYPIYLDPLEGIWRQLEKGDANLFEFAWRSRAILAPVLRKDLRAPMQACQEAEAIIYTSVGLLDYRIARGLRSRPSTATSRVLNDWESRSTGDGIDHTKERGEGDLHGARTASRF